MDEEQQILQEAQANWRDLVISRIGELNGKPVERLSLAELEWADKTWMPQIRMRWFEVDAETKRHYFALECAIQPLRPSLGRPIPVARARPQESPEPSASPQQSLKLQMPMSSETLETSLGPPPSAPITTRRLSVSDDTRRQEAAAPIAEEAKPPEEPLVSQKEQPGEPVSEESHYYQRVPLEEIIGRYGIAGIHPAAALLPEIGDEEFQQMCCDIKANGLLHPPSINDDRILLDGRTRLLAAWALGLDLKFERVNPQDVVAYVVSENIRRRHLSAGQKALLAEEIAKLPRGNPQFPESQNSATMTKEQAAALIGTNPHAITQARLIREWAPEEVPALKAGTQNLEQAHKRALKKKRQNEGKPLPKRKREPKHETSSAESEATLDNSRDVPQESVEVESKATREDCVKALFTFVEVLANSTDEPFDAALLASQNLDIAKFRAVWPKLRALMMAARDFITPP